MTRFWMFVIVALLTAGFTQAGGNKDKEKNIEIKGILTKDDPKDAERNGPSQVHTVKLKKGKVYTIDMVSNQLDSYLRLLNDKGAMLAEDDDSGGGLNAQIVFNCTKDGEYKIVTTTVGAGGAGKYVLTVKTTGAVQPLSSAHTQMLGKPAPDLKGDFAAKGKAVALSSLKGKVVLLDFCDMRSSSCITALPRLNEWNKQYKENGLAIVGVTYYFSEIGQALSFDKETGLVKTAKKSDRKSDQALLGDFAKHHKIDYLLMAIPKEAALGAYDAYVVNGMPQVVLIDRKGIVRMVAVGDKSGPAVEAELKKLLAEK